MNRYTSDRAFEAEVRHVADAIFDLPPGTTKAELFEKGKRTIEIDGVSRTRFVTHLIMATTSRKYDKVKEDTEKLAFASDLERYRGGTVKSWMVVEQVPDALHITEARKNGVELITFRDFGERLFDGRSYLSKRKDYPFGSARNPKTDSFIIPDEEFIEPPMRFTATGMRVSLDDIEKKVLNGGSVVILGPFGSGKSLTLRETWFRIRARYLAGSSMLVPIAINLREHWGAEYADEILRRHARSISYEAESELIAAWRAGRTILLIDGFDEVSSRGIATIESVQVLRELRRNALQGVRDLIQKSVDNVGIFICGRDHYFDNFKELIHSLGLTNRQKDISTISIEEFEDDQTKQYLERSNFQIDLPGWLPRRALLLGHLVQRDLLRQVLAVDSSRGQAHAWIEFLRLICRREAEHTYAAMDSETVQRVMEHLAVQVRSLPSGTGPISASTLVEAYREVAKQLPSDAVIMHLQRLPGLTERGMQPGDRSFVDQDLLETLQGAALARQLLEAIPRQYGARGQGFSTGDNDWYEPLGLLGCNVAVSRLRDSSWKLSNLAGFIPRAATSQLGGDLFQMAMAWSTEEGTPLVLRNAELEGVRIGVVDLDEIAIEGLTIKNSIIDKVVIGAFAADSRLRIEDCDIGEVQGIANRNSFPNAIQLVGRIDVEKWEALGTTSSIVQLNVSNSMKALLSALKKLFRQPGAGRVVGAFRRGVPQEVRDYVDPVLRILVREGFAWRERDVYHPVRQQSRRAHSILDAPQTSSDSVVSYVKEL